MVTARKYETKGAVEMSLGFKVSGRIAKPVGEVFDAVVNPKKLSSYFTPSTAPAHRSSKARR